MMPQAYVEKMAKKRGLSVGEAEKIWDKAKKASNDPKNFAVITTIFKKMIGEESKVQAALNLGKGDIARLAAVFNSISGRGLLFGQHPKGVNLDEYEYKESEDDWEELDRALLGSAYKGYFIQLLVFVPNGKNIELWGDLDSERDLSPKFVKLHTIPAKGFFNNKLIQSLNLFDPNKVRSLAKDAK